ncbi:NADP-dependent oxidoreductase domain-containing protein 1-like [Sinocyclocheilus grahami]|uniref:NADP-dependent oxidoreductase domain-containing protein 1-like n=1 Tax=Sinocyclocheilus grahami TaxID=75366 RepID=UPI0007ACA04C|nr:PREDICTED: NADP-dependent oxidoreductase domain-containing protein 1-like [Sinocyclocheilus grahami]
MGRQLATALLRASSLEPRHINISTRRPETLGGLFLDQRWVSAVLYSLLNMCTAQKLGAGKTLRLLNGLFETNTFTYHSLVNSPSASDLNSPDDLFPWMSLVDAQTKDTPLTDLVLRDKGLRDCFSVMYYNVFSNLAEG